MKIEHMIYGIHTVEILLKKEPERLLEVHLIEDKNNQRLHNIIQLLKDQKISHFNKTPRQLQDLVGNVVHQGIVARVREKKTLNERDLPVLIDNCLDKSPLFLVLDGIQDPHNLGACLRSADAAGVDGVILTKDKAVGLTPIVHKVASGAAETVSVIQVSNLARTLSQLKEMGVWINGAEVSAPQSLYNTDLKIPSAIVLGSEGSGLRRLTIDSCDAIFHIPMFGYLESLNVSVACGICLFEAKRQRIMPCS